MYTSIPADLPDPPFRFFEGLLPRLVSYLPIEFAQFGSRFLPEPRRKDPGNIDGFQTVDFWWLRQGASNQITEQSRVP